MRNATSLLARGPGLGTLSPRGPRTLPSATEACRGGVRRILLCELTLTSASRCLPARTAEKGDGTARGVCQGCGPGGALEVNAVPGHGAHCTRDRRAPARYLGLAEEPSRVPPRARSPWWHRCLWTTSEWVTLRLALGVFRRPVHQARTLRLAPRRVRPTQRSLRVTCSPPVWTRDSESAGAGWSGPGPR